MWTMHFTIGTVMLCIAQFRFVSGSDVMQVSRSYHGSLDGSYDQIPDITCSNRPVYERRSMFIYHNNSRWVISQTPCQLEELPEAMAESNADFPHLVKQGMWEELRTAVYVISDLLVEIQDDKDKTSSSPSTGTIIAVAVAAFVAFFVIFPATTAAVASYKKKKRQAEQVESPTANVPSTAESADAPPSYLSSFGDASLEELRASPLCSNTIVSLPSYDEVLEKKNNDLMPPAYCAPSSEKPAFLRTLSNESYMSNISFVDSSLDLAIDVAPSQNVFRIS